jgi:hypothetical protein
MQFRIVQIGCCCSREEEESSSPPEEPLQREVGSGMEKSEGENCRFLVPPAVTASEFAPRMLSFEALADVVKVVDPSAAIRRKMREAALEAIIVVLLLFVVLDRRMRDFMNHYPGFAMIYHSAMVVDGS